MPTTFNPSSFTTEALLAQLHEIIQDFCVTAPELSVLAARCTPIADLSNSLRSPFLKSLYHGFIRPTSLTTSIRNSDINVVTRNHIEYYQLNDEVANEIWHTARAVASVIHAGGNGHNPFDTHHVIPFDTPIPESSYVSLGVKPLPMVDEILKETHNPLKASFDDIYDFHEYIGLYRGMIADCINWLSAAIQLSMAQGVHSEWNFGNLFGISLGLFMEFATQSFGVGIHSVPLPVAEELANGVDSGIGTFGQQPINQGHNTHSITQRSRTNARTFRRRRRHRRRHRQRRLRNRRQSHRHDHDSNSRTQSISGLPRIPSL